MRHVLHWRTKLMTIVFVALAVAAALGKGTPTGLHW